MASLWRVYKPEWLVRYISDGVGEDGTNEATGYFEQKYQGRVRPADVKVSFMGTRQPAHSHLQLRLPNLKGEYSHEPDAEAQRSRLRGKAVVVAAGSAEERELLAYGKRRLPQ